MAQFGEILAELRQDRGLTQRDLAKLFFVTPGTISNYEKGRHLPDAERLIKIADYFSVTTELSAGPQFRQPPRRRIFCTSAG